MVLATDDGSPCPPTLKETPMFKTLVLGLVLAGVSFSFIGNVSAAPRGGWQPSQAVFMSDRHDPANTNGN
jgi:hypothetical protein